MNAVVLHRRLRHPIARVWRALDDPAELSAWMPGPGEVVAREEPFRIEWAAHGHSVRIELEPDGNAATRLTFTHTFPSGAWEDFAAGWEVYLGRLDALLAGRPLGEQEAHDERRLALGGGPQLRLERRLLAPPDRLWRALTEPEELHQWFPGAMEVLEADAPRRLVARWNGTTLRFELNADGDGTRLVFTHAFEDRGQSALAAAGWERCFARLEALLSGAPLDETASLALWPHAHERYAAAFGVDPEIGRSAFAARSAS